MMKMCETKDLYEGLLTKDYKTQGLFQCFQVFYNHSFLKQCQAGKTERGSAAQ